MGNKGKIIIYKNKTGEKAVDVRLENETVWLNAVNIASIFNVNRPAIVKHINNIYKTKELDKNSTCSILEQVAQDGKRRKINIYNLDVIISVGYRVNSIQATKFRIWATNILKQYVKDGYVVNKRLIVANYTKFLETVKELSETGTHPQPPLKEGAFRNGNTPPTPSQEGAFRNGNTPPTPSQEGAYAPIFPLLRWGSTPIPPS